MSDLPSDLLAWGGDPWITAPLLASGLLYLAMMARDLVAGTRTMPPGNAVLFWSGLLVAALALASPLHALGERLFVAHMVEHTLVIAVAAPLLVLGLAGITGFPAATAVLGTSVIAHPVVATILHGVAIWVWHLPGWLDASVVDASIHRWQHVSLIVTALLFWWSLLRRAEPAAAAASLFATMIHTGLLGALITMAPRVLYPEQTVGAAALCGLTPIEDQQLAGLVMWVPTGIVYAGASLALLARWIKAGESRGGTRHVLR